MTLGKAEGWDWSGADMEFDSTVNGLAKLGGEPIGVCFINTHDTNYFE